MLAGRRLATLIVTLALVSGCRRNDLVESQLRERDVQYREAMGEMQRLEGHNEALRREVDALRAGSKLSPEQAASTFGVRKIALGRGTGGLDDDRVPGDESLQVFLEPRDADDHTIKAPGVVCVAVLEINNQGQKVPLASWTVDPEKLRKSWKQGLLSVGYQLTFPWETPPRSENLRVAVKLTLPDGRSYETDRDVKVRLVPGATSRPETILPADAPQFRPTAPGPFPLDARKVTPAGAWTPTPLHEGVILGRPTLREEETRPPEAPFGLLPPLGEIRLVD